MAAAVVKRCRAARGKERETNQRHQSRERDGINMMHIMTVSDLTCTFDLQTGGMIFEFVSSSSSVM